MATVTGEPTYSTPDSRERAWTYALTRAYVLNWEVIAYTAIFVIAVLTRFIDLGARVMSHDESLHTYYSWRLYKYGEFSHTPLMHGPLLFHMTALSYYLFGDTDFTSRIYPAVLGVGVVMFPLLFRRWIGRVGAVIASSLLLISPQILYYTRYIRHDIPVMFFALLLLYSVMQYLDGARPRRAVWLFVFAGALLGMLASKEVAFIYIAIFGSFFALYWVLRLAQDVGLAVRRPASASSGDGQSSLLQALGGHALLLILAVVLAVPLGSFLRFVLSPVMWFPSKFIFQLGVFALVYVPLTGGGLALITLLSKGTGWGVTGSFVSVLARGKSTFYIILAGVIVGAILALAIVCIIDIIKPDTVWGTETILSNTDQQQGINSSKEYGEAVQFDDVMFVRLLTWVMLPLLVTLLVIFLSAVFVFPGWIPLPWREILLILLIALLVTSWLVMFERRSFIEDTSTQPFAADLTADTHAEDGEYNQVYLWAVWLAAAVVVSIVAATRLLTPLWDFFNRQPMFDVLILLGTLILPWLAAFPLYKAGYNLEDYNPHSAEGEDTLKAAVVAFIPFALVSISVGLAWSWKRFVPALVIFAGLFVFFFTTVFSNQYGLATGMIGSLGYWLEQQEVRRGGQPQYYYILTQLLVYEFLPLIGAVFAGGAGMARLWRWRRARAEAAMVANERLDEAIDRDAEAVMVANMTLNEAIDRDAEAALTYAAQTQASSALRTEVMTIPAAAELVQPGGSASEASVSAVRYEGLSWRWFRPYDPQEDAERAASDPEWIGSLPFLGLVGYWGILILLALTAAGEKMPWLTTHLTLPLILLTGWWLGEVVSGLKREALREGGWLLLLVAVPLLCVGLAQVLLPLWGHGHPFQGREVDELYNSGNWLAALLLLLVGLYLIGRFGLRIGAGQTVRLVVVGSAAMLGVLTARAAIMAAYINYDYATEFLVYAHAGPAVKTVLNEINRISTLTNEGENMRIVFDDESSWPYTWYFRDYPNYGFLRGEAGSVEPSSLLGARVVVVGGKKVGDVRQILGDGFYEFDFVRLWWPMQEYFHLTYDRVANVFSTDPDNPAAEYYREGLWDIWLRRDYTTYGQAMCIEDQQLSCKAEVEAAPEEERDEVRRNCHQRLIYGCQGDDRFAVNRWPVSDKMYFFVDKSIAAQIWDAGIGGATVDIREPTYAEDDVYVDINAEAIWGEELALLGPRGIAVDAEGEVYVADTDHSRVVVIDSGGQLARVIGVQPGGGNEPGALRQPWGLDIGPDGLLYVADTWNHRVQVFTLDGEFVRMWGHEGLPAQDSTTDAFWGPRDIAVSPDGKVYVADTGNKRVRVYTLEGEFIRDIGGTGTGLGQLDEPVGLGVNPVSGNLYVAEAWNRRVQVFDQGGLALRMWNVNMWFNNQQSYNRPYLEVSQDGTLVYVTDMDERHRIVGYDLNGVPVIAFNQPDDLDIGLLGLRSPAGMAFGPDGRLYVVDAEQARIFVFPPSQVAGGVLPVAPSGGSGDALEATEEATEEAIEATEERAVEPSTEEATEEAAEVIEEQATEEATEEVTEVIEEATEAAG